jgi:hypothetical protein
MKRWMQKSSYRENDDVIEARLAREQFSPRKQGASKFCKWYEGDRLCGLVVRVSGHRSRGLGSIPGATTFSEKWV